MSAKAWVQGVGMAPWRQRHWDVRAACNYVAGGAGSGLVVATAVSGVHGAFAAITLAIGLALVGSGLFAVWLELGRPWRAINVLRNPRTSWMSREAYAATVLFGVGTLAVSLELARSPVAPSAMLVALIVAPGFAYCQGRMLQAAKGIPAWRSPALPALIVATALAEGAGAWWIAAAWAGAGTTPALALFLLALVARLAAWLAYRRSLRDAPLAAGAISRPGAVLAIAGTFAPLALVAAAMLAAPFVASLLVGVAGALALVAGWGFKFALVLRASFNQGYALPHAPVRGQRASPRP
jgi:phenylacetyl-CoA:acceptor oxidoreductase subunit 2